MYVKTKRGIRGELLKLNNSVLAFRLHWTSYLSQHPSIGCILFYIIDIYIDKIWSIDKDCNSVNYSQHCVMYWGLVLTVVGNSPIRPLDFKSDHIFYF